MKTLIAHEKRQARRQDQRRSVKKEAEEHIERCWNEWKAEGTDQRQLFKRLYQLQMGLFDTPDRSRIFRECMRAWIIEFDESGEIVVPSLDPVIPRRPPTKTQHWIQGGSIVKSLAARAEQYIGGEGQYSEMEAMGWLLFSSIVWGGIGNLQELNALKNFVQTKKHLREFEGKIVLTLPVEDQRYGNITEKNQLLGYARQFVPDAYTQCWLVHLYGRVRVMSPLDASAEDCLTAVLKSINAEDVKPSTLLKNAGMVYEIQSNASIPVALTQVAQGLQNSCSLDEKEMALALSHQHNDFEILEPGHWFSSQATVQRIRKEIRKLDNHEKESRRKTRAHVSFISSLLKLDDARLRRETPALMAKYEDIMTDINIKNDPRLVRLCHWTLVMILSGRPKRISSLERYFSALAFEWILLAPALELDGLDSAEWSNLYKKIITKSKNSSQVTKTSVTYFHAYHMAYHEAPPILLSNMADFGEIVRARYVSPALMHHILAILNRSQAYNKKEQLMLEVMIILAWRCGFRVSEIIHLRLKDLSVTEGEHINEQRVTDCLLRTKLKTSNAIRRIPLWGLLSEDERLKLDDVWRFRVSQGAKLSDVLFAPTGAFRSEFKDHHLTSLFTSLTLLAEKRSTYSFHSLRHTALSSLALILTKSPLASVFTDKNEAEQEKIREAVLGESQNNRRNNNQDHYIALAQLAGHGTPTQTFKSYFHFAQLDMGFRLAQGNRDIACNIVKNTTDISNKRLMTNVDISKNDTHVPTNTLQPFLSRMLKSWIRPWKDVLFELPENKDGANKEPGTNKAAVTVKKYWDMNLNGMTDLDAFPGQKQSSITMEMIYQVLQFLDQGEDVVQISSRFGISRALVQRWKDRATFFANCTSSRNQPKFNDPKRQTNNGAIRLCPVKRQTVEEERMVTQAFGWLPKFYYEHRADLLAFLNIYFNKASGSRAYLRFRTTQTDELMFFMEIGFLMFSPSKWQLTATKTSMARKVKKSNGDRWKELNLGESDPSYNGYTLVLKNPNENLGKSSRYYSTNALRFIMHMALIAWPSGDVSHYRKKHRDPYSAS